MALLTSQGKVPAQKLFMIGLGTRAAFSPKRLRSVARMAAASAVGAGVRSMAIECFHSPDIPCEGDLAQLRDGLAEGAGARPLDVSLLAPDAASYEKISRSVKVWSPEDKRAATTM